MTRPITTDETMRSLLLITLLLPLAALGLGTLPDASQEGLLSSYRSYASLAVFHYTVPPEVSRATWKFASFQDRPDCPRRRAHIHIQHGSLPLISADGAPLPGQFYLARTFPGNLSTLSEYQPDDSTVYPVYNPLPGSWFVVSYLDPVEERIGLKRDCRYSLGSVALWSKNDDVELLQPNLEQVFRTSRDFSYYKFFLPDGVSAFRLRLSDCVVHVTPEGGGRNGSCIDFADLRARALPFSHPESLTGRVDIAPGQNATFVEMRPYQGVHYYLVVVSQSEVSFKAELTFHDCGEPGLYGRHQKKWHLSERGLIWSSEYNATQPKEPTTGFQLFSSLPLSKVLSDGTDDEINYKYKETWSEARPDSALANVTCASTFDFSRIAAADLFTANYLLQGRSWYTRWITVLDHSPVYTRFDTLDFLDLGGFLNIRVKLDPRNRTQDGVFQAVVACLAQGRQPDVSDCSDDARFDMNNRRAKEDDADGDREDFKAVPYPEPGRWYIGFRLSCVSATTNETSRCPARLRHAMVSVDLHLQPCGYAGVGERPCGRNGVCLQAGKGLFRYSACSCLNGRRGLTCEDASKADPDWKFLLDTLFLTLSNLAFLPAVVLAVCYGLYTEAFVYASTMVSSTFYHACDQEALTGKLPPVLQSTCSSIYINHEVLQFCDFYCATLAFWFTILALARLPPKLVNFLNIFGMLLVAILVQYNRTGIGVFVIPIPLGVLVLLVSLYVRGRKRGRMLRPNRACSVLVLAAGVSAGVGLVLFTFVETSGNYSYVHSVWHMLMAVAILLLLPRCRDAATSGGTNLGGDAAAVSASNSTSSLTDAVSMDNEDEMEEREGASGPNLVDDHVDGARVAVVVAAKAGANATNLAGAQQRREENYTSL